MIITYQLITQLSNGEGYDNLDIITNKDCVRFCVRIVFKILSGELLTINKTNFDILNRMSMIIHTFKNCKDIFVKDYK